MGWGGGGVRGWVREEGEGRKNRRRSHAPRFHRSGAHAARRAPCGATVLSRTQDARVRSGKGAARPRIRGARKKESGPHRKNKNTLTGVGDGAVARALVLEVEGVVDGEADAVRQDDEHGDRLEPAREAHERRGKREKGEDGARGAEKSATRPLLIALPRAHQSLWTICSARLRTGWSLVMNMRDFSATFMRDCEGRGTGAGWEGGGERR